jgi:hypothetical protein
VELLQNRFRWPRFKLAEVAGLIAAVAVGCTWPPCLFLTLYAALVVLLDRIGLALVWILIVCMGIAYVVPFVIAPVRAH